MIFKFFAERIRFWFTLELNNLVQFRKNTFKDFINFFIWGGGANWKAFIFSSKPIVVYFLWWKALKSNRFVNIGMRLKTFCLQTPDPWHVFIVYCIFSIDTSCLMQVRIDTMSCNNLFITRHILVALVIPVTPNNRFKIEGLVLQCFPYLQKVQFRNG